MTTPTVDDYIAAFPEPLRARLEAVRAVVRAHAPEATERVSYGLPTYFMKGNIVHFGAFKHHIGFYPTPTGIEAFATELARYKGAKGSVQFPHAEPLPLELIAAMVKFRVAQHARHLAGKQENAQARQADPLAGTGGP